jgi:hypothetical protein
MNYKKISTKRENEIAEDIGGRRHTGSGNKWHSKGDASNEFLLIEDKFVISDKYSIQLNIINKLTRQAQKQSKIPVLRFGFVNMEFLNNFACIETCYCNPLAVSESYSTNKKSNTFTYTELYTSFILMYGQPVLLQLTFEKEDRNFFIIEWEDFLKFQQKIIVSI